MRFGKAGHVPSVATGRRMTVLTQASSRSGPEAIAIQQRSLDATESVIGES